MGFRRGLLLGMLAGAIGAVMGRPRSDAPSPEGAAPSGGPSAWNQAVAAVRQEQAIAEQRLRSRLERARATGHLPDEPD